MTQAGSELVSLVPTRVDWRKQVTEDILTSDAVRGMEKAFAQKLIAEKELKHAQADATVKICMKLKGQGNYRMSKMKRSDQPIREEDAM